MFTQLTSIAFLFLAAAILMLSAGLLGSLTSLRAMTEGFSDTVAGLMMSTFYIGLILGSRRCDGLINRIGHIRAFSAFCAINIIAVLTFTLLVDETLWLAMRVVIGFNMAGIYMVMESWINTNADGRYRGTLMAIYTAVTYLAMGGGQLMLNLKPITAPDLFIICAMLLALAALPVITTASTTPAPVTGPRFRFRELWKLSPIAICTCSGAGILMGATFGVGPIFGRKLGLDIPDIALLMFVITISGMLLQWPFGRLSDLLDRRTVIAAAALCAALSSLAIVPVIEHYSFVTLDAAGGDMRLLWQQDPLPMLLVAGLFGGTAATLYPLSVAWANDRLSASQLVGASGGLVMAYGAGAILGPLGAGFAMTLFGPVGLFWFTALVAVIIAGFALLRFRLQQQSPIMEKETFVAMPDALTNPITDALDPRTPDPEPMTQEKP